LPGLVCGLALSPDGRTLATSHVRVDNPAAPRLGEIQLWKARTGAALRTLKGHKGSFLRLAFSPDGRRLASAGGEAEVRVWDVTTGRNLWSWAHPDTEMVLDLAFSRDGRLATAGDGGVCLWDVATGKPGKRFKADGGSSCVAFSADGKRLGASFGPTEVRIWNTATGAVERRLPMLDDQVMSLAFSPDDRWVVAGGFNGSVVRWDLLARPQ